MAVIVGPTQPGASGWPSGFADCFRFRNKVGLDVALEALRECLRARRCTMDELWAAAGVCSVQRVMRPYLEAMP